MDDDDNVNFICTYTDQLNKVYRHALIYSWSGEDIAVDSGHPVKLEVLGIPDIDGRVATGVMVLQTIAPARPILAQFLFFDAFSDVKNTQ
jgi:hypothetical protein